LTNLLVEVLEQKQLSLTIWIGNAVAACEDASISKPFITPVVIDSPILSIDHGSDSIASGAMTVFKSDVVQLAM
jgi:hypothetical protein